MFAAGPEVIARTLAGSKPFAARKLAMFTAVWNGAKPWSDTTITLLRGAPCRSTPVAWMMRCTASFATRYALRR